MTSQDLDAMAPKKGKIEQARPTKHGEANTERLPFMVPTEDRRSGYAESEGSHSSVRLCLRGTFIDTCGENDEDGALSPRALSDPGSEVSSGLSSYFVKEKKYVEALSNKVSKTLSEKQQLPEPLRKSPSHTGSFRHGNSSSVRSVSNSSTDWITVKDGWTSEDQQSWVKRGLSGRQDSVTDRDAFSDKQSIGAPSCSSFTRVGKQEPGMIGIKGAGAKFPGAYSQGSREALKVGKREPPITGLHTRHSKLSAAPSSNSSDGLADVQRMPPVSGSFAPGRPDRYNSKLSPEELRSLVHKKTEEFYDVLSYQRLSTALTSIHEIPEQVSDVLQLSTTHLLDEVQVSLSVATGLIVNSDAEMKTVPEGPQNKEQAAENLTMIPEMIMASFENSFARAMSTVRNRVDDVIQGLEGSDPGQKEQVVRQMWQIPDEVRQITREAVKEASLESREKVAEQLDTVFQAYPEESISDAFREARQQIVATVPKKLPDALRAATVAAETNVCQAVKAVQQKREITGVVANRVVADTLLRAKVGPSLKKAAAESPGLQTLRVCNPGSVGHPELCMRACLYFASGKCSNGMDCAFCHAPHSKKATHLDKRHREMMRAMSFKERFDILHPILKDKFMKLEVGDEAMKSLEDLGTSEPPEPSPPEGQPLAEVKKRKPKETRTLQIALKFLSVRSLLTLLQHAPSGDQKKTNGEEVVNLENDPVELLIQKIRPDSCHQPQNYDYDDDENRSQSEKCFRWHSRTPSRCSDRQDSPQDTKRFQDAALFDQEIGAGPGSAPGMDDVHEHGYEWCDPDQAMYADLYRCRTPSPEHWR